jgi:outer membrane protein OmpA-like peptidoglycan-associated protein
MAKNLPIASKSCKLQEVKSVNQSKGNNMNKISTHSRAIALSLSAVVVFVSGCANMTETQRNTSIGAGVGGLAGMVIGDSGKSAAIGAGLGALGGYIWSNQMAQKKAAMEQATVGTGVAVTQTADNQLKLNIPSDISFDTGRSDIKYNLRPVLDQFAQGLSSQPNTEIRIVGHTDSTGSDAINNPLSFDRAASARDYLASRGVDSRRIQIDGRGSREPIASNGTDAGRAANRRIEIFLAERAQR